MADIRPRGISAPQDRIYQALLGLKAGLEGGQATPYPDDLSISSWG